MHLYFLPKCKFSKLASPNNVGKVFNWVKEWSPSSLTQEEAVDVSFIAKNLQQLKKKKPHFPWKVWVIYLNIWRATVSQWTIRFIVKVKLIVIISVSGLPQLGSITEGERDRAPAHRELPPMMVRGKCEDRRAFLRVGKHKQAGIWVIQGKAVDRRRLRHWEQCWSTCCLHFYSRSFYTFF